MILITQRSDFIKSFNETRDSLDQRWTDLFSLMGCDFLILPNKLEKPINYVKKFKISGVIISGGNNFEIENLQSKVIHNRDTTEISIINYCIKKKIPILGICRGMQVLNLYHGGKIEKVLGHVGTHHNIQTSGKSKFIFDKRVNSFHKFSINQNDTAKQFDILAKNKEHVEAFYSEKYNQLGIMWHPERNKPFSKNDLKLIKNFFKL